MRHYVARLALPSALPRTLMTSAVTLSIEPRACKAELSCNEQCTITTSGRIGRAEEEGELSTIEQNLSPHEIAFKKL